MHKVKVPPHNIRTDIILEQEKNANYRKKIEKKPHIKITKLEKNKEKYTSIEFQDITDYEERKIVEEVLIKELKKYIKPTKQDRYLLVGLGNPYSTPDSLGPKTMDKIIVTRYLEQIGPLEEKYASTAIFKPDVSGNTGISSIPLIKSAIKEVKPTKIIIIDALKARKIERLVKIIQITNTGIHPGSGILNDQGEISETTIKHPVIAIGIPTIVDKDTMIGKPSNDNFMVTPTNIDFLIDKLSSLLGDSINKVLHQIDK